MNPYERVLNVDAVRKPQSQNLFSGHRRYSPLGNQAPPFPHKFLLHKNRRRQDPLGLQHAIFLVYLGFHRRVAFTLCQKKVGRNNPTNKDQFDGMCQGPCEFEVISGQI